MLQVSAEAVLQGVCRALTEKYEGMKFQYWREDGQFHRIRVEAAGIPIKTLRVHVEGNSVLFEDGLELL